MTGEGEQIDRRSTRSMGTTPADWAASTRKNAPASRTRGAIVSIGCTVPRTLEAWVITTSVVFGPSAARIASASTYPWVEATRVSEMTPVFSSARRGRLTELCSRSVVTTWSPG